jgi:hypothetical protein
VVVRYNLLFVLMMNELMEMSKVHQIKKVIHVDRLYMMMNDLILISMSKQTRLNNYLCFNSLIFTGNFFDLSVVCSN